MSDMIFGPASRGFISSSIAGSEKIMMNGKAKSRGNITASINSSIEFRIHVSS